MRMPTYTSTFHVRRKLYAIYDWELPFPLEVPQVVAFVLGLIVTGLVVAALGIHMGPRTLSFVVGIPIFLAWRAPKSVADGKPAHAWLVTQLTYLAEPRVLHDLRAGWPIEPDRVAIKVTAWQPRGRTPSLAQAPEPVLLGPCRQRRPPSSS